MAMPSMPDCGESDLAGDPYQEPVDLTADPYQGTCQVIDTEFMCDMDDLTGETYQGGGYDLTEEDLMQRRIEEELG